MASRVKRVYAELGTLEWHEYCRPGTVDSAFVTLHFENSAIAELMNSWAIAGGRACATRSTAPAEPCTSKARGETGILAYSEEGYGRPLEAEAKEARSSKGGVRWS